MQYDLLCFVGSNLIRAGARATELPHEGRLHD